MAVKFGHLNSGTKVGFELQEWNIYGEQQGTIFLTTEETNFRTLCCVIRRKTVHTDTIGSETFIEWKTTGSLNNFKLSSKRKVMAWTAMD
jgi:hypothetical protein